MIIEKQKEAIVLADGDASESIGMSLDLDSAQILMQMLSKNLYSDAIGSTIRECASNALDSHRRAGTDDPIIVSFKINDKSDFEFSVEDFGIGLDHDDVQNIISKYGKSTKRNSNTELGMMGLGFKAPLAYTSSFYFVCRKDGIERKYMMYEGEDVNTIDLLYEMPTSERNGVKVIVPVQWRDRDSFYFKIQEQLAYFDSVYFDVIYNGTTIDNNFKIYRGESFQYSELARNEHLHLCLDNVYYPLDFQKLGINALKFPVGLRFSLTDGIYPTPNREAIRYTPEAKQIILDRLSEMADFFVDKYNKKAKVCENYNDVYQYYTTNQRMISLIEGVELNVGYLSIFSKKQIIKPSMPGVKHIDLEKLVINDSFILGEYNVTMILNRGKMKEVKSTSYESDVNTNKFKGDNFYIYSERIPEMKKAYFRSKLPNSWSSNFFFIKKTKGFPLFPGKGARSEMRNYHNILNLKKIDKKYWREAIIEFQKIIESITSKWINVDEFEVPESFVSFYKMKTSKTKNVEKKERYKGEDILLKRAVRREVSSMDRYCKFESQLWKIKDIPAEKKLIIYSHHDDSPKLDKLYSLMKDRAIYVTLSHREMKILEGLEFTNTMSYEDFMKGKCGAFRRMVTAKLIMDLQSEYNSVFQKSGLISDVNSEMFNLIEELKEYKNKNHEYYGDKSMYDAVLEVAKETGLYDDPIHTKYLKLKKMLEKIPMLEELITALPGRGWGNLRTRASVYITVSYFKHHKMKVNLEHYSGFKKEEEVTENQ